MCELQISDYVDVPRMGRAFTRGTGNSEPGSRTHVADGLVLQTIDTEACRCIVQCQREALRYVPVICVLGIVAQWQSATGYCMSIRDAEGGFNGEQHGVVFNQTLRHLPVDLSLVGCDVSSLLSEFIAMPCEQTVVSGERWIARIRPVGAGVTTRFGCADDVLEDHAVAPGRLAIGRALADALTPAMPMGRPRSTVAS